MEGGVDQVDNHLKLLVLQNDLVVGVALFILVLDELRAQSQPCLPGLEGTQHCRKGLPSFCNLVVEDEENASPQDLEPPRAVGQKV